MTFEKFANLLFPIIGGGMTTGKFALELFCEIIEYPEELEDENPLSEQLVSTFKSYFNGTRKIRSLAKKVNQYIETTKFETYIDAFEEGALFNICCSFQDYCPEITTFNVAKKMAELFQSILLEAVNDKKKSITSTNTGDGLKRSFGVSLVIGCAIYNLSMGSKSKSFFKVIDKEMYKQKNIHRIESHYQN